MFEEKRSYPRTTLNVPITCDCYLKYDQKVFSINAVTLNMSEAGISFYSDVNISHCYRVDIKGTLGNEHPKTGKVAWVKLLEDLGIFRVGVSLKHGDEEMAERERRSLCLH